MSELIQILEQFDAMEAKLLYGKAVSLLSLITTEEFDELISHNSPLFTRLSRFGLDSVSSENLPDIEDAIELFIQTIESRSLTLDEFEAMTLDDIKDYIISKITYKEPKLLRLINELENGSRT